VGGCDGESTTRGQFLEDRASEGCAFAWIGTCAELVHQHQGISRGALEDLSKISQVRTEGRETRLDRLLVADVGEDVVEQCDTTLRTHGCRNAGLRQSGDEAECLEKHGLAPGVRAGDEESALLAAELEVERDDAVPPREQERMAAVTNGEPFTRGRQRH
jgi:hypothetical protein